MSQKIETKIEAMMNSGFGRKRICWIIAATIALMIAAYPASSGPAYYLVGRDWLSRSIYDTLFGQLNAVMKPDSRYGHLYHVYTRWWFELGWEHAGRRSPFFVGSGPITCSGFARMGTTEVQTECRCPKCAADDGRSRLPTGPRVAPKPAKHNRTTPPE